MSRDGELSPGEASPKVRPVGRPRTLDAGGGSLALVLNLIRLGEATARLDIERRAELGRAAVADRLATLEHLGLIAGGELGVALGGRAPRHLRFVAEAGVIAVALVDRSSLAVALADLSGQLFVEHHEAVDLSAGPEAVLERLTSLFVWLLDERGGKDRLWGMGVSLTEAVLIEASDGDAFVIGELDTLRSWRRFDFAARLSLRFGAPSWVRGAAQMMTVGELKAGAGQGVADMLFLKLDHSIGAGVAAGGRVQQGAQGFAGMVGHAPTGEDSDVACHCGARGCLDAVASGDAIARRAGRAAQDGRSRYLAEMIERNGEISAADVSHGAQLGEAFCAELLARCGRLVGQSLAPMVNLLNPAVVVLGGAVAQSGDILLAAVREAIYRQSHPLVTRDLRIVRSQMGNTAGLVGAAQMVCDELFAPAVIRDWIALGSPRRSLAFLAFLHAEKARERAVSGGQARIRAAPALPAGSQ